MVRVLFVTSETHPLIKTGGLADVSGALPPALRSLRCDVRLLMPAYPAALSQLKKPVTIDQFYLPGIAGQIKIIEGILPGTRITVWLVDYPAAFDREGNPYLEPSGSPWPDNAERFAVLCKVACALALNQLDVNWTANVVHCNDWQTGLIPALLHTHTKRPACIFTIHNLSYQGLFPFSTFSALGLSSTLWSHSSLEFHGQMSFIKGGLVYADRITTVSPQYADEIKTNEFGCGLEGLLKYRSSVLTGIVNGIDHKVWNPAKDKLIVQPFDLEHLRGKSANRQALQKRFNLAISQDLLLIGFIGRIVDQKGIDLILGIVDRLAKLPVQLVILGSGDPSYENALLKYAEKYSSHISVVIGYDEALAHLIEAGADAFLMPSKFEPCGLNQLYSLRYGTLPIVHRVGGLADTVIDISKKTLSAKIATGIVFNKPTSTALFSAIERTLELYKKPRKWRSVMRTAMAKQFNWRNSAKQYIKLYKAAISDRTGLKVKT